jgi:hypothetical protein
LLGILDEVEFEVLDTSRENCGDWLAIGSIYQANIIIVFLFICYL